MRRALVVLGVTVAVVVLAELGARALSPHLPEAQLYADATTATKVAQLDALDCADVVFAGNSMTRDGLDPRRFAETDPVARRTYNAALDAATPALLRRWVLDEVVPRVHPDGVVLGLSSFDLNDNAAIAATALEAYDDAPLTRDDVFGRLQAPFIERFDLFRYRNDLRDPEQLWHALGRWRDGVREPRSDAAGLDGLIGPQGQGLSRQDLEYVPSPASARFATNELLNDFHLGGAQAEATGELLDELADRGIDTAVLVLPVTEDYVGLHPDGAAQHEEFLALAERLAEESGATFLDLHDLFAEEADPNSFFADTHHLNGAGANRLSRALPELLGDDFAAQGPCENASQ